MLTKDLVRCRRYKGQLRPGFVDTENAELIGLAERLLACYTPASAPTRAELADDVEPLLNGWPDPRLAKGLNKLILDGCRFGLAANTDFAELRARVFARSADLLRQSGELDLTTYRAGIAAAAGVAMAEIPGLLYADLPAHEVLTEVRELTPKDLLQRYNCALVQALLMHARELRLQVSDPDAARLRRLLKYLRFFRLLAALRRPADDPDALVITVDGPANLIDHTQKYGLQLATFFPAVCGLRKWSLTCALKWRDQPVELALDETAGLVGHYRHFGAYVPEEVQLFAQRFRETVGDWRLTDDVPFLDAGDQQLIFPDCGFLNAAGDVVYLELFHRWHRGPLLARLAWLASHRETPLILGVDRSIAAHPDLAGALEASSYFAARGFLFRDYPTVPKVRKCLAAATGISG